MVFALLDGRKTQTRRKVNFGTWAPCMPERAADQWQVRDMIAYDGNGVELGKLKCPYGQVGDVMWVRETLYYDDHSGDEWCYQAGNDPVECEYEGILTRTDKVCIRSIHMPYIACRLFLKIISIRAERVQDISETDAIAEGCEMRSDGFPEEQPDESGIGLIGWDDAPEWYAWLWESIHGPESWEANPWVFVVEFEKTDRPE